MASLSNSNTYARSMNGISSISANQVYTEALSVGQLEITSGITATQSQVINFGSNAPIMQGTNITNISGLALPANIAYENQSNTFTLPQVFSTGGTGDAIQVIKTGTNGYIFLHNDGAIGYWNGTSIIWNINSNGLMQSTGGLSITGGSVSFTNPPTMSGANISAGSIPDSALTNNIPRLNGYNDYYAINNFSSSGSALNSIRVNRYDVANAFTFLRTDGITGYTPDGDVANTNWSFTPAGLLTTKGGITASNTQTINFGSNAPTMSGANISAGSIADTALSSNIPRLNVNNTFTGLNTFTQPPIMSGSFITSGSIGDASIANAEFYAKTNGSNTFQYHYANTFDGTNTYTKSNTFTEGVTTSMSKSVTNPVVASALNSYTYYFTDNTTTPATFKSSTAKTVYYVIVGGGGGGSGNSQNNEIGFGGGGGGAGKVRTGSFTAVAQSTYTLTVGSGGIGSAGIYTGDPMMSNTSGGAGGTTSIAGSGVSVSAIGGGGGLPAGAFTEAGDGGLGGDSGIGGQGASIPPSPTGTYYGTDGVSFGGGGGGNAGGGTATLGNTFTVTPTDAVTYTFQGGRGGGDITSGQNATTYGGGGQGGGCNTGNNQTATQSGGNGFKGFVLLYVLTADLTNVTFNCLAKGLTLIPATNSTDLATTAYVKSQYDYNNTFTGTQTFQNVVTEGIRFRNSLFGAVQTLSATGDLSIPLASLYVWASGSSITVTLPNVADIKYEGLRFSFRRITTSNTNTLTVSANTGQTILDRNSVTATTSVVLLTSNATPSTAFYGEIMCIAIGGTQVWAVTQ